MGVESQMFCKMVDHIAPCGAVQSKLRNQAGNKSDNEKAPTLRGNVSDKREAQENGGGASQPLNDDIPF